MTSKKKRSFIRILFFPIVIIIFLIGVKNISPKTIKIEENIVEQGIYTKAFVIQKEDIVYLNKIHNLDLKIEEGDKVAVDSVIGNSNQIVVNNQDAIDLEIINQKLETGMYQEKGLFDRDLEKINKELTDINIKIQEAENENNKNKVEKLQKEKKNLQNKKQIIETSFRYAFTNNTSLNKVKDRIEEDPKSIEGQVTPKKLGIEYSSYVFTQKDGFENLLHRDLLGSITPEYLDQIEEYMKEEKTLIEDDEQILKFIDGSKTYLAVKIPENSFSSVEKKLIQVKKNMNSQWKKSRKTSFYSYIENRRDILKQFPQVTVNWNNHSIAGYVLDSNKNSRDNEKVLTIKVETQNHNLIGQRQNNVYIYDKQYKGFIIPKQSVLRKNARDGVILLKENKKEFIEINIKYELNDSVVLDPSDNEKIKPGARILVNP